MGLESNWANTSDVVRNHYGVVDANETLGGKFNETGPIQSIEIEFSYDDLPGGSATGGMEVTIPAGAMILDAYWETKTAFAGGTSYDIGLQQTDGSTEIDYDGLWDALVLADINAEGERRRMSDHAGTNSGALAGVEVANEAQLRVAATGTFTAGVGRIIITYMPERAV